MNRFYSLALILLLCTCFLNMQIESVNGSGGGGDAADCQLPKGCLAGLVDYISNQFGYDNHYSRIAGIHCTIRHNNALKLEFPAKPLRTSQVNTCFAITNANSTDPLIVELHWPSSSLFISSSTQEKNNILDEKFNMTSFLRFFIYSRWYVNAHFINLKGFDLNIEKTTTMSTTTSKIIENHSISSISFINCRLVFYADSTRRVRSCVDVRSSNVTTIRSIFQISMASARNGLEILLKNCEFKDRVCPCVFRNANIRWLHVYNLVDSFYRRNVLEFWNDEDDDDDDSMSIDKLNSTVSMLFLDKIDNVDLDTRLLNPRVFASLESVDVRGYVRAVSSTLFDSLPNLRIVNFRTTHFRKLAHNSGGIEWIRRMNAHLRVNMSNRTEVSLKSSEYMYVLLSCEQVFQEASMSEVFPDEDFCIYAKFPFDQLVFLGQYCANSTILANIRTLNPTFTCTYMWINQYANLLADIFKDEYLEFENFMTIVKSKSYESAAAKCEFEKRLARCQKSKFKIKHIWSVSDYYSLNKKLQSVVKITTYLVALFGIITNYMTVGIIFGKNNKEIFKDLKHYAYLGFNSAFSLVILLIELLSWTSECFYPFEVFCPQIHKSIFIQLSKMIFKECLVTFLRFMCNFCLVAFALSRIALIGKNPCALVEFMAKLSIKKYMKIALIASFGFSWIKFFKYRLNFGQEEFSFPKSNEFDILTVNVYKSPILDFYFVFNSMIDLINYGVFVLANIAIDVYMIVRLKRVLKGKIYISKLLNIIHTTPITSEAPAARSKADGAIKMPDFQDSLNKSTKMVLFNTVLGVCFKLPLIILPLLNVYAQFYYKNADARYRRPSFDRFYSAMFETGFNVLGQDIADMLFSISLAVQIFIYDKFDKKFKSASFKLLAKIYIEFKKF